MSEHIPEAAVEANARELARQYGFDHVWTHPDTGEEMYDRDYWMDVGRKGLAAALPHLVTDEAVERAILRFRDAPGLSLHSVMAQTLCAALGIQDEQEAPNA